MEGGANGGFAYAIDLIVSGLAGAVLTVLGQHFLAQRAEKEERQAHEMRLALALLIKLARPIAVFDVVNIYRKIFSSQIEQITKNDKREVTSTEAAVAVLYGTVLSLAVAMDDENVSPEVASLRLYFPRLAASIRGQWIFEIEPTLMAELPQKCVVDLALFQGKALEFVEMVDVFSLQVEQGLLKTTTVQQCSDLLRIFNDLEENARLAFKALMVWGNISRVQADSLLARSRGGLAAGILSQQSLNIGLITELAREFAAKTKPLQ